ALFNTFLVAAIGPVSINVGSDPITVLALIFALGFRFNSSAFSRDISSTALAPSLIWLAFPAVIFPSSLNTDFNPFKISLVVYFLLSILVLCFYRHRFFFIMT